MKKYLLSLALLLTANLSATNYLSEKYLISFGSPEAPLKVTEYFSFLCPHCVVLFREDFPKIKAKYIDKGEIYYVFHPIPMDLVTIQAMDCLEKLKIQHKRAFLEAMLEEIELSDPEIATNMMQRAMEIFGSPIKNLSDRDYLSKTDAYTEAYEFMKEDDKPNATPSLSINGHYLNREVPTIEIIQRYVDKVRGESN